MANLPRFFHYLDGTFINPRNDIVVNIEALTSESNNTHGSAL